MTKIELLKAFAKGWFGNSQQHSIHAQLLKARGLNKLGDKSWLNPMKSGKRQSRLTQD